MNCKEFNRHLQAYVDADLDEISWPVLEAHRRHCYTCTESVRETRNLLRLLDEMEREPAPVGLDAEILSRLVRLDRSDTRWGRSAKRHLAPTLWCVGGITLFLALLTGTLVSPSHWTAGLGSLATWWYGWVGDLLATGVWLRSSSLAELQQASASLLRAGDLLLRASVSPLLLLWSMTTLAGLCMGQQGLRGDRSPRSI